MEILFSLDEIAQVAQKILHENPAKVMVFNVPMGAGHTRLLTVLSQAVGVKEATRSRSFTEWAEKIPNLLPDQYARVDLSVLPDGKRKLALQVS